MRDFQNYTLTSFRDTPLQAREPGIIMIQSNPFTAGFDGQCSKPSVRYQVSASVRFCAKAFENVPVPLARLNDHAVWLDEENVAKPENFIQAAGHRKDFRVGGDADHTTQDLRSHTVTRIAINHAVKPAPADLMVGGVLSESVHENVDVGKYHGAFMTSSRSLERFRSIPGSTPPVALDTGNSIRLRGLSFALERMSTKPSSTSDVRVRLSSAARFLARFRRLSFILMVVLMHQYITLMHQYVKHLKMSWKCKAQNLYQPLGDRTMNSPEVYPPRRIQRFKVKGQKDSSFNLESRMLNRKNQSSFNL